MKNTLIELAKKHGAVRTEPMSEIGSTHGDAALTFTEDELEAYSAELLQANSGNAVDERAAFDEWWNTHHLELNHKDILRACESAFISGRASLANKPELRVYIEHDFVCVRTETGQLLASKKLSDFKANEFLAITKG